MTNPDVKEPCVVLGTGEVIPLSPAQAENVAAVLRVPNPEREDAVERMTFDEWLARFEGEGETTADAVLHDAWIWLDDRAERLEKTEEALLAAAEYNSDLAYENKEKRVKAEAERDAWILNSEAGKDGPSVLEIVAERDDYKARVEELEKAMRGWQISFEDR